MQKSLIVDRNLTLVYEISVVNDFDWPCLHFLIHLECVASIVNEHSEEWRSSSKVDLTSFSEYGTYSIE